eukprot:Em0016g1068a
MNQILATVWCLSMVSTALSQSDGCNWVVESVTYPHPTDSVCKGQGYVGSCKGACPSSAVPRMYENKESLKEAYNPFESNCKCCEAAVETCDKIPIDMKCPNGTIFRVKVFQCTALSCACSACKS